MAIKKRKIKFVFGSILFFAILLVIIHFSAVFLTQDTMVRKSSSGQDWTPLYDYYSVELDEKYKGRTCDIAI